jgi:hypothetical protein
LPEALRAARHEPPPEKTGRALWRGGSLVLQDTKHAFILGDISMRVMRGAGDTDGYQILKIHPLTGALGAEISGVDLSRPLSGQAREEIKRALYDHLVVYFHDQVGFSRERHLEFAQMFGPLQKIPHTFSVDGYPMKRYRRQ